jgi:Ca2+-binding EF-hand superfamily protein
MLDSVAADKNGKITVNEARSIFNNVNIRLGRTFTINQVDEFFSSLHLNREGRVSFSEFKYAFESIEQVIERKEKIRNRKPTAYVPSGSRTMKCVGDYCTFEDIFEDVDVDGDGMITKEETAKTLLRLNSICRRSYGTDELEIFFSTLDKERKGSIALKDFKEVLTIMENYDDETL